MKTLIQIILVLSISPLAYSRGVDSSGGGDVPHMDLACKNQVVVRLNPMVNANWGTSQVFVTSPGEATEVFSVDVTENKAGLRVLNFQNFNPWCAAALVETAKFKWKFVTNCEGEKTVTNCKMVGY